MIFIIMVPLCGSTVVKWLDLSSEFQWMIFFSAIVLLLGKECLLSDCEVELKSSLS